VTGSVVRVTGSGLGCPTWPSLLSGQPDPDPRYSCPAAPVGGVGNRMPHRRAHCGVALACSPHWATGRVRRRLTLLALSMPAGVVAQAVTAGSPCSRLAWWTVSCTSSGVHVLSGLAVYWSAPRRAGRAGGVGTARRRPRLLALARSRWACCSSRAPCDRRRPARRGPKTPRLGLGVPQVAQLHGDLMNRLPGAAGRPRLPVPRGRRAARWPAVLGADRGVLAQGSLGARNTCWGCPRCWCRSMCWAPACSPPRRPRSWRPAPHARRWPRPVPRARQPTTTTPAHATALSATKSAPSTPAEFSSS